MNTISDPSRWCTQMHNILSRYWELVTFKGRWKMVRFFLELLLILCEKCCADRSARLYKGNALKEALPLRKWRNRCFCKWPSSSTSWLLITDMSHTYLRYVYKPFFLKANAIRNISWWTVAAIIVICNISCRARNFISKLTWDKSRN